MAEYTYKAFISYSWADAKWGKWLQQAVETYRTPKALIEKHAGMREIPARLTPLFKDREEQAAGASIGASIEAALADSEYLIVICSPQSAQSQWVNHEIAWFKTNRNPDKILALIVDGEPGDAERECFPKALTHKVAPDLTITDAPDDAPLAADAREGGDGKRLAKMKLVAAMLGVGLDQLLRRDDRRRVLRARVIAGASLALALVMSGLTWFAVEARNEADRQRAEADGLIEFMLTDLREKLEPVGRLDALDVVGQRALTYYAGQSPGSLDADSLGRRARALLLVGEITNIRGNSEEALKAFTQAAATTQEQLARDPDNEQRIFDHAQSVFWVGYIAYNRGELENAEAQFREYKRLADRLIELNPDKPEWQMESSYAEGNLGALFYEQRRYDDAATSFKLGVASSIAAIGNDPFDAAAQVDLGIAMNWVGLAEEQLGRNKEALELFRGEAAIYEEVLELDPSNAQAKYRLAIAMQFVCGALFDLGEIESSLKSCRKSNEINADLRRLEPDNSEYLDTAVRGWFSLAERLVIVGKASEARGYIANGSEALDKLLSIDETNAIWSGDLRLIELRVRALLAIEDNEMKLARNLAAEQVDQAKKIANGPQSNSLARAYLLAGDLASKAGNVKQANDFWEFGTRSLPSGGANDPTRYRLMKRLQRTDETMELAASLDRRGYKHPAYLSER
uniref:toll/interleukin-1 receptor domain-containing protein n=1 Tax=uncultured Altererythrobacter sp. TaxID=500840 RepID=UPI00262A7291|nr:toll/interleukin-1 receptor domain-containing protein [uncultured Altererythrobacter sp.]